MSIKFHWLTESGGDATSCQISSKSFHFISVIASCQTQLLQM